LDKRIRNAELNKIPYCLVVGEREAKSQTVSVRKKGKGDLGTVSIEEFIKKTKEEIDNKK
jgi:threonyl-tRNA synthetase